MRIKRICAMCGADYWTGNGKAKYCSDKCRKEATKQRQAKWRADNPDYHKQYYEEHPEVKDKFKENHPDYSRNRCRKIRGSKEYTKQCVICGKTFTTWLPHKTTCSDECNEKRDRTRKRKPRKRSPEEEHRRWIIRQYGSEEAYQQHLAEMEKKKQEQMEQKRLRQETERAERQKQLEERKQRRKEEKEKNHRYGICVVCGSEFETYNPAQKTCCKECGKKLAHAHKHKRIPKKQIIDKDITLEALYRRDSGVCYLCGKPCDWNDKNDITVGPMYPSIDHVIPISHGGMHSWKNIKLAHFECNWKKSDTLLSDIC